MRYNRIDCISPEKALAIELLNQVDCRHGGFWWLHLFMLVDGFNMDAKLLLYFEVPEGLEENMWVFFVVKSNFIGNYAILEFYEVEFSA